MNVLNASVLRIVGLLFISLWWSASTADTLIRNVRIISGDKPQTSGPVDVLIDKGRIIEIGSVSANSAKGATLIEGSNRFLIPGLIDTHVHLEGVPGFQGDEEPHRAMLAQAAYQIPRSYLYFGFTTLLDLASSSELIQTWNRNPESPEAFYCIPVTIPNAYPLAWMDTHEQFHSPIAHYMLFDKHQAETYPDEFNPQQHSPQSVVDKVLQDGASCIKLYYETGFGRLKNLPVPAVELASDLVARAKQKGLSVYLHGNSESSYKFAMAAGVDVVAHGMWHWSHLDLQNKNSVNAFAKKIAGSGIAVQPTMQVLFGERELFNPTFFEDNDFQAAVPKSLMRWYKSEAGQWMKKEIAHAFPTEPTAPVQYKTVLEVYSKPINQMQTISREIKQQGGTVLFASDTPSGPIYTQFPGYNGRREMDRWLQAGFSLEALFVAMTTQNAKWLGKEHTLGEVKVGYQADLLLLKTNPLKTIKAYDSIEKVIKKGRVIDRKELKAN